MRSLCKRGQELAGTTRNLGLFKPGLNRQLLDKRSYNGVSTAFNYENDLKFLSMGP